MDFPPICAGCLVAIGCFGFPKTNWGLALPPLRHLLLTSALPLWVSKVSLGLATPLLRLQNLYQFPFIDWNSWMAWPPLRHPLHASALSLWISKVIWGLATPPLGLPLFAVACTVSILAQPCTGFMLVPLLLPPAVGVLEVIGQVGLLWLQATFDLPPGSFSIARRVDHKLAIAVRSLSGRPLALAPGRWCFR